MRSSLPTPARRLIAGALALAAVAACADQTTAPPPSRGLTPQHASLDLVPNGTNLRTIEAAYSQGWCSVNTGIAFDGTNLILSCWYYPVLDFVSPADGHLVKSVTIGGAYGFGALAWDASQGKLWACESSMQQVVLIDVAAGTAETKFSGAGCIDGLAYDGTDNTLWMSPDVSPTLYHYTTTGTMLASFPVAGPLNWYGNSGIAVGGEKLYLANDGASQIYEASKDLSTVNLFATFPRRLEDLECDDVTFSQQGVGAIWSIDAYDRTLNAWAIPAGKCKFGGGGGGEVCQTPPTVALAATPGLLWPPDHRYVKITVQGTATPGCAGDALTQAGTVVSNQADEETPVGDGHTTGDIRVTHADGTVLLSSNASPTVAFDPTTDVLELRAERYGTSKSPPRVYTITFTATSKASGKGAAATATVVVDHDQRTP